MRARERRERWVSGISFEEQGVGESLGRDASHWRSGRGLSDSMLCYTCLEAISYISLNFHGNLLSIRWKSLITVYIDESQVIMVKEHLMINSIC